MSAAEHQRAGAVEGVEQRQVWLWTTDEASGNPISSTKNTASAPAATERLTASGSEA